MHPYLLCSMSSPAIGLIVTGSDALKELQIFASALEVWHPDASLYIYTDDITTAQIKNLQFKGTIKSKSKLNQYVGKNRYEMESLPGKQYDSMWKEFMYEKANVIEWMFDEKETNVWFMDADITFLAPLPTIPENTTLALCPHYIRECDTARYGIYNGGFLWMSTKEYLPIWRNAGHTTRFFEQSALEDIATTAKASNTFYEFPIQVNFGWWRMFQSVAAPPMLQQKFSIFRDQTSIGVRYDGMPLQSVHTHWNNKGERAMVAFNQWFKEFLVKFKKHKPIAKFHSLICG